MSNDDIEILEVARGPGSALSVHDENGLELTTDEYQALAVQLLELIAARGLVLNQAHTKLNTYRSWTPQTTLTRMRGDTDQSGKDITGCDI